MNYTLPFFIEHPNYKPFSLIPWNIEMVNAPSFWNVTKGGGRVVAVIDTGLEVNHPEFAGRVYNPINLTSVGSPTDVTPNDGQHGTHVAGIIGGKTVGVAPECHIMPIKVFGDNKVNENINNAFRKIIEHNASCAVEDKVVAVNCSFGAGFYDVMMAYLIRKLVSDGVIVCVAAGNEGDGKSETEEIFSFPAYINEVVTVASINQDGLIANYSNSFDGVDIATPGTYIYSAWGSNGYNTISGTSMATPHVCGACALLVDRFYIREGRMPKEGEIDGLNYNLPQANGILFKHIKSSSLNSNLVGMGILDLTYENKNFPLYRVQCGGFFNRSGSEILSNELISKDVPNFIVKY